MTGKKIILFGSRGAVGKPIAELLAREGNILIPVGRDHPEYSANIEDPKSLERLFQKVGTFDAVVSAVGEVAFGDLDSRTADDWTRSLRSKLMGQIEIVQRALPFITDRGSFTLVSGILSDEVIKGGTIAMTVNRALEGFVQATARELPRNIRINLVSPNLLEESVPSYGEFFPGFVPVPGRLVAQAFKKSIFGIDSGKVFRV